MNVGFSAVKEEVNAIGERIIVDAEGNRVVAASRRPDGSLRKEIRIRKGYLREEEKERFATKGTEFRRRVQENSQVPVGFRPVSEELPILNPTSSTISTKKKKKKSGGDILLDLANIPPPVIETFAPPPRKQTDQVDEVKEQPVVQQESKDNPAERLQSLKKRLAGLEMLEQKRQSGTALTADQKKKLKRREAIEKEIAELETTLAHPK